MKWSHAFVKPPEAAPSGTAPLPCGHKQIDHDEGWGGQSCAVAAPEAARVGFCIHHGTYHCPHHAPAEAARVVSWKVDLADEAAPDEAAALVMCMDCGARGLTSAEMKIHHCPPGKCHAIGCADPRHIADHDWIACDERHGCGRPDGCHREPRCDVPKERHPTAADTESELAQEWVDTHGYPDDIEHLADVIRTSYAAGRKAAFGECQAADYLTEQLRDPKFRVTFMEEFKKDSAWLEGVEEERKECWSIAAKRNTREGNAIAELISQRAGES